MTNYVKLREELLTDSLGLGLSGMDDVTAGAALSVVDREQWVPISGDLLFRDMDGIEFGALSAADKTRVDRLFPLAIMDVSPGSNARGELAATFGPASTTVGSIVNLAARPTVSRSQEIGHDAIATEEDVRYAREDIS